MREPAERADVPRWYNICHEPECGGASAGGLQRQGEKIRCEFWARREKQNKTTKPSSPSRGLRCFQPTAVGLKCLWLGMCTKNFYQWGPYCHIDGSSATSFASKQPRSTLQMACCCAASGDYHLLECPPTQANVAKQRLKKWAIFSN